MTEALARKNFEPPVSAFSQSYLLHGEEKMKPLFLHLLLYPQVCAYLKDMQVRMHFLNH
uniref:Uncharacterized protein n=1 Tax=Rhizophora mucronata TaxID=61149 RepID=A0A2P2PVI0_RHIMU